jgi:hypothetical protein
MKNNAKAPLYSAEEQSILARFATRIPRRRVVESVDHGGFQMLAVL